jgi:hypothetical protein
VALTPGRRRAVASVELRKGFRLDGPRRDAGSSPSCRSRSSSGQRRNGGQGYRGTAWLREAGALGRARLLCSCGSPCVPTLSALARRARWPQRSRRVVSAACRSPESYSTHAISRAIQVARVSTSRCWDKVSRWPRNETTRRSHDRPSTGSWSPGMNGHSEQRPAWMPPRTRRDPAARAIHHTVGEDPPACRRARPRSRGRRLTAQPGPRSSSPSSG